jgi:hypothetical protein
MMFLFRGSPSIKDTPSPAKPSGSPNEQQDSNTQDQSLASTKAIIPAVDSAALDQPRSQLTPSLKLLLGGISFFLLSTVVTRRALRRRRLATIPPFYTGSTYHQPRVNGAMEAFEALNIATINVVSVAMLAVGSTLYGLDINSIDEMRRFMRGGSSVDGALRSEKELEEELEEWVASVLDRKEKRKQREAGELEGQKPTNENGRGR